MMIRLPYCQNQIMRYMMIRGSIAAADAAAVTAAVTDAIVANTAVAV